MSTKFAVQVLACAALGAVSLTVAVHAQQAAMTFFVTSVGKGDGGNLGGLEGADAHCVALAKAAGATKHQLEGLLEHHGTGRRRRGQCARAHRQRAMAECQGGRGGQERRGPAFGCGQCDQATALTEKGEAVSGRGDAVNTHDILTGSDPSGLYSTAGGDTNCGNWTKNGEGSAIVGHHDRAGLKDTRHMKSWNSSHGTRGCGQDALKGTGGAGLFYCFATD